MQYVGRILSRGWGLRIFGSLMAIESGTGTGTGIEFGDVEE